jgi:hypothetical protein
LEKSFQIHLDFCSENFHGSFVGRAFIVRL